MERKEAASSPGWRSARDYIKDDDIKGNSSFHPQRHAAPWQASPWWAFRGRIGVAAMGVVALVSILTLGLTRQAPTNAGAVTHSPVNPTKPAYTRAEEAYIQALWPIHGDVERSTLRVSLGKIFYTTNDLSRAELKTRIDAAMATYQNAEERISALQTPPSLTRARDDYLAAVGLFKQSATESLRTFYDGNDNHLLAAYPLSQEGSTMIRAVGARFWQDEFPPN